MKISKLFLGALGLVALTSLPARAVTVETQGFLKYECWFPPLRDATFTGTSISILQGDPNYPNTPDMVSYAAGFDTRPVFPDDTHDEYGARLTGWITPAQTGDYIFYIKSDDASQLWISTDSTETSVLLAAEEPSCCNPFMDAPAQQTTLPTHMQAGQKYAVQIFLKEGGGGDFVQVAMQNASGTTPAASLTPLVSTMISSMADPAGASLTISQQPQSQTTPENVPVTFSVVAEAVTPYGQYSAGANPTNGLAAALGTKRQLPAFYQWFTNGMEVAGANGASYTIPWPKKAQDGTKVKCYVAVPGIPVYSSEVTLTVGADSTPPTIVQALANVTFTTVSVKFSEPVTDSALAAANYTLDQGATVVSVSRVDLQTVALTTSRLTDGQIYTLTVNAVQDTATPANPIVANTKVQFRTFVFMAGTILHQKYTGFNDTTGYNDNNLFNDPRYNLSPDRSDLLSMWEYPAAGNGRDSTADPARMYMDTIEGFFIPPTSGDYVFLTCGADRWPLYLSTDESPANKVLIAQGTGWTNPRGWNLGQPQNDPNNAPTDMTPARSDTYGATQWPNGNTINLTGGKRYYMQSVHYDPSWSGADDFAVTYKLASDPDPVPGDAPKLTGSVIGFYFDPSGARVSFTEQPQNTTVLEGNAAILSAVATGSSPYGNTVVYQWETAPKGSSTWTKIANATAATYKTPLLTLADDGTQYRVVVSVPPISDTSSTATVSVVRDNIPPVPSVGAMQDATSGTVDVGVTFDEPVDNTSASLLANYSISAGTIASIQVYTNRFTADSQNPLAMKVIHSVLLKVTGLSGNGTLTIKNVADVHGNAISSVSVPFTVDTKMKWGVVGANEFGGVNAVVATAPNGFDVYSDGMTEWANYDETTFVYEPVTGDFDKKLRVQYQDGSSTWARAGLIVREATNFGVDRATQSGGEAGRYQKCHVNPVGPVLSGPGNPGNQAWEGNRRLDKGGNSDGPAFTGANAIPQYPNAWCRIQRVGQKFTIYRSDDGVNWVALGATTWGVDDVAKSPMPATLYVGPEFTPENGNIATVDQGTFLAQFRDYGDYVAVFNPQLKIGTDSTGKVNVTWTTGTLVSAPTALGPYTPVAGAVSPFVVTPAQVGTTFYRVKQ